MSKITQTENSAITIIMNNRLIDFLKHDNNTYLIPAENIHVLIMIPKTFVMKNLFRINNYGIIFYIYTTHSIALT